MIIKRVTTKNAAPKTAVPTMVLPTKENIPPSKLSDYTLLIYGRKKAGKTSLCSKMPNPFFISTEPGTKALRVRAANVKTFKDILSILTQLEAKFKAGEKYCDTLVWDTIDLVYEMAFDHVCKTKMINHPSEEKDYGQTWREISSEFRSAVLRSLRLGCGVVFLSHDTEKEVEVPDGLDEDGTPKVKAVMRRTPTMVAKALNEIEGLVDVIGFYEYDGARRCLHIAGREDLVAGCRCEENFLTPGGERVLSVPMGDSAQEAVDNLQSAFTNLQESVDAHPRGEMPAQQKRKLVAKKPNRK